MIGGLKQLSVKFQARCASAVGYKPVRPLEASPLQSYECVAHTSLTSYLSSAFFKKNAPGAPKTFGVCQSWLFGLAQLTGWKAICLPASEILDRAEPAHCAGRTRRILHDGGRQAISGLRFSAAILDERRLNLGRGKREAYPRTRWELIAQPEPSAHISCSRAFTRG